MDTTELKSLFRSVVGDETAPYLWSDAEVYTFMDVTQKLFCRRVGGIQDSRSGITQLNLTANQVFADVSPLILRIKGAQRSDGRPVEILNYEDVFFNDWFAQRGTPGPLKAIIINENINSIRLFPMLDAAETLSLVVERMPAETIVGADQQIEIDEQHHYHMLDWMKHLAYQKNDAETFDRGKSIEAYNTFMSYVDEARVEKSRREHKPRTVAYGGI